MRHWRITRKQCGHQNRKYLHLPLYDRYRCNFNGKSTVFDYTRRSWPRAIATTTDNQKWQCGHQKRIYLYLFNCDRQDDNSDGKSGVFDHSDHSQCDETDPRRLQQRPTTGIAIWTFCSPISQLLAVGRCRNDLANHLLSSTSSKIPNLA